MARLAVAIVGLAIVLFVAFAAVDATVEQSRHTITIDNETFAPSGGELQRFNFSNLARADYDDTVTVRNASNDQVLDAAGNYTWHSDNGTLRVTSGSDLASADDATITLNYTGQTIKQTAVTTVYVDFLGTVLAPALLGFVVLLIGVLFILGGLT